MIRSYPIDGVSHLVNETYEASSSSRFRAWSFQPGDIVRNQLFDDMESAHWHAIIPMGLVLWCADDGTGSAIGILWSGDPDV